MSDSTPNGLYCAVCHKRRPEWHFEERPEHAGGRKITLAERRELGEMGADPQPRRAAPRPRQAKAPREASGILYAAQLDAWRRQLDGLDGLDGLDASAQDAAPREIDVPWWSGLALVGGLAALGGFLAWASRQGMA